jgi:HPt (histidine-containing phosphotransfer) domain-containing protein
MMMTDPLGTPPPAVRDAVQLDAMLAELREEFRAHAAHVIRALIDAIPGKAAPDAAALERIVREAHTLKGTAGTVGLPLLGAAAAEVESRARTPRATRAALRARLKKALACVGAEARR